MSGAVPVPPEGSGPVTVAMAATSPSPSSGQLVAETYVYLAPSASDEPSSNEPATRLTLTWRQGNSRLQREWSWTHWSAPGAEAARDGLTLQYRYRQPLLIFGFLQLDSHLTLQTAWAEPSTLPAVDGSLQAAAVIGNLAASLRVAHRSRDFWDLPPSPALDLFPVGAVATSEPGTLAETEFRTSLSNLTWIGNISWRWPAGQNPQVGLAVGPQLRLGEWGSVTAKLGLRSDEAKATGVLDLSTAITPWSGVKVSLEAVTDTQASWAWDSGLDLALQLGGLRGQARFDVHQRSQDPAPEWGTHFTTQAGAMTLGLDYRSGGATGLSVGYVF
ncbi:MAG: hypothetical protein IMX01_05645 [Limnochordaceae bacterium]|nr:hypothetical protein [Limnochordaceae bacterium]